MSTAVLTIANAPPTHERVYQSLRDMILFGDLRPGHAVTLQGVADQLGVSMTPAREAVRRLIVEQALQFHGNRRISVPQIDTGRLDELYDIRLLLEPRVAAKALSFDRDSLASRLEKIDVQVDQAIAGGDIKSYLTQNYRFHFELYEAANSAIYLPIVASLWLQVGPFLRVVCGRMGTSSLADHHKSAIDAIRKNDKKRLMDEIRRDLSQGLDQLRVEIRDVEARD